MSEQLERLAAQVGVNERTLRRAIASGLLRARRPGVSEFVLSEAESVWVAARWPLVARLLAALRTERNVELAVLFGVLARHSAVAESGIDAAAPADLLVQLRDSSPILVEALKSRLEAAAQGEVTLVPLQAAMRDGALLAQAARDGRPLVDRTKLWPTLRDWREHSEKRGEHEQRALRSEARAAISYFQGLSTNRFAVPFNRIKP